MEKNVHVVFCRKVLVRLVMGTPFMRKELQEVSSNDCSVDCSRLFSEAMLPSSVAF